MNHETIITEKCKIFIDNKPYSFDVSGKFFWGKNEVLFNKSKNVINGVKWESEGYKIIKLLDSIEFARLSKSIKKNIIKGIETSGIRINGNNFNLKDYHKVITNDIDHLKVINYTRNLRISDFDIDFENLAQKFSNQVNSPLSPYIKELKRSHIQIRINRPNSLDINPPHRDGYLSYWKNILNVWLPIEGCNEKSSLPIISKSHLISELNIYRTDAKGAYINNNNYYVPCILKTSEGNLKMIRPNPKNGEALIFTPFLIHGAAFNLNEDTTRIALELRFDKK